MFAVLLLTEDSGERAFATFEALARKILHLLGEPCDLSRVVFERADERGRAAMGFNAYKSTSPRDHGKQLDLANAIATRLLRGDEVFVFVHVDGDRRWSERGPTPPLCDNQRLFEANVLRRVRAQLEQRGQLERLERLLYVLPFWSVEAWLYQNTAEALKICAEHDPRHERDLSRFQNWAAEPAAIDEVERPKHAAQTFQDRYNARLARSFPAGKAYSLGLSFAYTVDRMKASAPLTEALARVRHG